MFLLFLSGNWIFFIRPKRAFCVSHEMGRTVNFVWVWLKFGLTVCPYFFHCVSPKIFFSFLSVEVFVICQKSSLKVFFSFCSLLSSFHFYLTFLGKKCRWTFLSFLDFMRFLLLLVKKFQLNDFFNSLAKGKWENRFGCNSSSHRYFVFF